MVTKKNALEAHLVNMWPVLDAVGTLIKLDFEAQIGNNMKRCKNAIKMCVVRRNGHKKKLEAKAHLNLVK